MRRGPGRQVVSTEPPSSDAMQTTLSEISIAPHRTQHLRVRPTELPRRLRAPKTLKSLGVVLHDLSALNLDFDLEATGFAMAEIELHIDGLEDKDGDGV